MTQVVSEDLEEAMYREDLEPLFCFTEHDYDPRWDYLVRTEYLDHPLIKRGRDILDDLSRRDDSCFKVAHVFPAELSDDIVACYCSGTYAEPVILIDISAHKDHWDQLYVTLRHEIEHALQESRGEDMNEDGAELAGIYD